MKRYISVWLPNWAIECHSRRLSQPYSFKQHNAPGPFVLVAPAQGGIRVMAANNQAKHEGISVGQSLADARLLSPTLKAADHDPSADAAALTKLTFWLTRYSPWVSGDPTDGLLMDITGCAHLLGGETALAEDLMHRLNRFGITSRIAIAGTIGAAWAFARHSTDMLTIVESDKTALVLRPYPISALRVDAATTARVSQVGLKTIGAIAPKPRAPLAARYGKELMSRLDQAFGLKSEALSPITPPPEYRVSASFIEPIQHLDAVAVNLDDLITSLAAILEGASVGARRFDLTLYRVDGGIHTVMIRTSVLTANKSLINRLFTEKLKLFAEAYDVGFGIDQLILAAFECERSGQTQSDLTGKSEGDKEAALQMLLDRYSNRFGRDSVGRFIPQTSYIPERSERLVPVADAPKTIPDWNIFLEQLQGDMHLGRPIALLPRPEPITAIAEVPDGPPVVFEWRRLKHRIICAEGPERIAPEWWARPANNVEPTRDYYRVEDNQGYRYWLYRQGLYERGENPNWFMHGFFA
jgi:protein ImuB